MVNESPEWYFFNLILIFLTFYLFVFLISIFGYIFFRFIRKLNKSEWNLHFLEIFIVSFAIGLSIYISLCFIIDIFMFFNFFSAYLPLIVIDGIFLISLIHHKTLTKEKLKDFISRIKARFTNKPRDSIFFITIICLVLIIQITIQWRVITQYFALPSLDTYGSVGHLWHLMNRGYLWRDRYSIHYPKGFHFFLVAPILINPDFSFAYLYYKFLGIPLFSFYLFIIAVILKKNLRKNYLVITGLMLVLNSNHLVSKFCYSGSSLIPTLIILISIIIIRSNCPFYLTGFLLQIMFVFNPAFAACYIMVWFLFTLIKLISKDYKIGFVISNYIIKPLILALVLILTHILHTFIVSNVSLNEFLGAYGWFLGTMNLSRVSSPFYLKTLLLSAKFSEIPSIMILNNVVLELFADLEERLFSLFIIFAFIGLFFPTKKYFKAKFIDIINLGKLALVVVISLYTAEIIFGGTQYIFIWFFYWVKTRAVEAFTGPIIIFCCFSLKYLIEKTKIFTIYLKNNYYSYRHILAKTKILRIENIIITILLISVFSTFFVHRDTNYNVEFEDDYIETMFYIKDNIRDNSKILVNFYDEAGDTLTSLLSTYRVYDWEFSEGENDINEIKQYIDKKGIEYVLIDLETVNSIELYNFTSDIRYENIYDNEVNILFEYK